MNEECKLLYEKYKSRENIKYLISFFKKEKYTCKPSTKESLWFYEKKEHYFSIASYKSDTWFTFYFNNNVINIKKLNIDAISKLSNFKKDSERQFHIRIYNIQDVKKLVYIIFGDKIQVNLFPNEIDIKEVFLEGAKKQVIVNAYERNSQAREECIKKYGYQCIICKFDFYKVYGEIGKDFIHVHHLLELSEIKGEYEVNPDEDLRPVCPNCHAMLHKKKPAYSIETMIEIIEKNKGK